MATGNPENSPLPSRPGVGFAVLFIFVAAFFSGLAWLQPQGVFAFGRALTVTTTTALGSLLGLSMTSNADIVTVNGFAMRIVDQCTAFNYVIILTLAMLLSARHTWKYRLAGIIVSAPVIVLANAVRLIITGMTGTLSMTAFNFVHEYLWVALFALLVFGIWKVWTDKGFNLTRQAVRHVAVVAASCTAAFTVMIFFKGAYSSLLASLASPLFRILLGDPQSSFLWDGSFLRYGTGTTTLRMGLFFEIANVAVYVGLMLPYLWRNRKAVPAALTGLAVLVVMYAEFIACMGVTGIRHGKAAADFLQFIGSGMFLALPMALYWIVAGLQGKGSAGIEDHPEPA